MFFSELPRDRDQRWQLLGAFLEAWFPTCGGTPGVASAELEELERRLGLSLPAAFLEWYGRYGARQDVWSLQDRLLAPEKIKLERDVLVFCIENQSVVRWGIRVEDLAADDPPVVVSDQDGSTAWFVEGESTSAFAVQFAVLNAKWSRAPQCGANGQGTDAAFAAIARSYPRMPFPELRWPERTRIYGRDDILIENNADTWIWATARSERALAELDTLVRDAGMTEWEAYEVRRLR